MTPRGRPAGGSRRSRRGVFTFEWILVTAILVIGTISGVYAVRDAIVNHYKDLIQCICKVDVCECIQCDNCDCLPP